NYLVEFVLPKFRGCGDANVISERLYLEFIPKSIVELLNSHGFRKLWLRHRSPYYLYAANYFLCATAYSKLRISDRKGAFYGSQRGSSHLQGVCHARTTAAGYYSRRRARILARSRRCSCFWRAGRQRLC